MHAPQIITQHLDIWTAAHKTRSSAGRGSSNKLDLYGIKKLRELILELAVHGKLVSQDPDDEPASELLKKIATEKTKLIKEGKIKKEKPLPEIDASEAPFELPDGWKWIHLAESGVASTGGTPKTSDSHMFGGDIPFIGPGQISPDGRFLPAEKYLTEEGCSHSSVALNDDILMVCIGGSIGKSLIVDRKLTFNQQINCISPIVINSRYLNCAMNSTSFQHELLLKSTGSATPIINRSKWEELLVALPPLAEQHRIVAKVDELMSFCDQLEQTQSDNIAAHAQLVEALLATLTNSSDHNELQTNWQRIAAHFDSLFTTEHSIDKLKQTILQLAVMGKLVPQNPNDEPASELLKKIATEKAQLIKEGKIKKEKQLPEITDAEKPFELPDGWKFLRIGELSTLSSGKGFKAEEYSSSGARLFQIANVSLGFTKWDIENYLPLTYLKTYPELELKNGDVLIALNRPLLNMKMKVCIISEYDLPSVLYQRVGRFNFYGKLIDTRYFYFYLQSGLFINRLNEDLQGSDQPFINQSQVITFLCPLPPLDEQHRIVAKVDELMVLCDTLKTNLQNAQTTQLALADVLVAQAVN